MATAVSSSQVFDICSEEESVENSQYIVVMPSSRYQLLFSKSKVYIHPTSSAKDNIPGYLALVKTPGDHPSEREIYLSWIPENLLEGTDDLNSYVKVDLNSSQESGASNGKKKVTEVLVSPPPSSSLTSFAFSIPLKVLYSVQVRPPSLGWWWGSLVFHTRTEETLPALFFHDSESESTAQERRTRTKNFDPFANGNELFWGGEQFLQSLKNFAVLEKSTLESTVILVNPEPEDRLAFSPRGVSVDKPKEQGLGKALKDARWALLEKLSRVTRYSRNAALSVIDKSPEPVKALLNKPEVRRVGDEFDVARVYLAKWAMSIAEEAEKSRSKVIWNDNYQDMLLGSAVGDFELLSVDYSVERRNPVGVTEWQAFFDYSGRLSITVSEVKERIFHGGVDSEVRKEAWMFLLGVYPWDSDEEERKSILSEKRNEYYRLKRKWWDDTERQQRDEFWRDQKSRIEKDVHRTDRNISLFKDTDTPHPDPASRFADVGTNLHLEQLKDLLITYNEYNVNLGYVQGMSDLLSPLYVIFQDDSIAFWAFCNFMKRMERNFLRDQSGMRDQLLTVDQLTQLMLPKLYAHLEKADSTNFFFFFRMLLVWFKREFAWDDVLRLWEVLWTDYLSSQFHLFIALAILDKHKDVIMEHLQQFDEILKYMNDLSGTIDLEDTLIRAEMLFNRFRKTVDMIDRKRQEEERDGNDDDVESPDNNDDKPVDAEAAVKRQWPPISDSLRLLLSKDVIEVRETERNPQDRGG